MKRLAESPRELPANLNSVALKLFAGIMQEWSIKAKDARVLLGNPPETTYFNWLKTGDAKLGRDTLERISHLQNIYKSLRIIFPSAEQANAWVHKPNDTFHGQSALAVMLQGSILDLHRVHVYLDGVRGS
jgi:uncharacterized protein (DUF2384 family)